MRLKILLGILGVLVVLLIIQIANHKEDVSASDQDQEITRVRAAIRSVMKDPDALQFGDIYRSSADTKVICGSYNAKNSFGAYTGASRFLAGPKGIVLEENEGAAFVEVWSLACRR
jgi:hypothetical protein